MDIKGIKPTASVTYEVAGKGPLTLEVEFIPLDAVPDYFPPAEEMKKSKRVKFAPVVRALLIDAIVGWDLTEDGKPLPCDDETKAKYLPVILGFHVKGKSDPDNPLANVLGRRLLEFAGDPENFLKN